MENSKFQKGNKSWQKRTKHGRDMLFATPELMKQAAEEYFSYASRKKWYKHSAMVVDKELKKVRVPMETPFTLTGLCLYLGCGEAYFRNFKADKVKCTPDFSAVIEWIEQVIENQLFEGAAVGAFNANLISRKLGLIDKTQSEVLNYNTEITAEEAKAIAKALNESI